MLSKQSHLIQAEFFPPEKGSLEATILDASQRAEDGLRAKTIVRFFDQRGSVARLVYRRRQIKVREEQLLSALPRAQGRALARIGRKSRALAGTAQRLSTQQVIVAVQVIRKEIEGQRGVGIEDDQRGPFRMLAEHERHELIERISVASKVWLWIFETEDILTEEPGQATYFSLL